MDSAGLTRIDWGKLMNISFFYLFLDIYKLECYKFLWNMVMHKCHLGALFNAH